MIYDKYAIIQTCQNTLVPEIWFFSGGHQLTVTAVWKPSCSLTSRRKIGSRKRWTISCITVFYVFRFSPPTNCLVFIFRCPTRFELALSAWQSKDSIAMQVGCDPQIAIDLMEKLKQHNNPLQQSSGSLSTPRQPAASVAGDSDLPTDPKPPPTKRQKVVKEKVKAWNHEPINLYTFAYSHV